MSKWAFYVKNWRNWSVVNQESEWAGLLSAFGLIVFLQNFNFSTLKRCQTQSLVWWWLDQKGANSPNILHSHLYWHPTIHSCLAKISWSGFEHGSNADDNHCTLMHFFPISKRYWQTRNTTKFLQKIQVNFHFLALYEKNLLMTNKMSKFHFKQQTGTNMNKINQSALSTTGD